MNPTTARDVIADALREIAPEVELELGVDSSPLGEQFDLDSMDLLELLTSVSERTGVDIPESRLRSGWSLDDLVGVLVAAAPPAGDHSGTFDPPSSGDDPRR